MQFEFSYIAPPGELLLLWVKIITGCTCIGPCGSGRTLQVSLIAWNRCFAHLSPSGNSALQLFGKFSHCSLADKLPYKKPRNTCDKNN